MPLHLEEQRRLLEALVALECGDCRTFSDVLWLTFGAEWIQLRDLLRDAGFIRYTGASSTLPVITDEGLDLIAALFTEVGTPSQARSAVTNRISRFSPARGGMRSAI